MSAFKTKMTEAQCRDTGMAMVLLCLLVSIATKNKGWVIGAIALQLLNMVLPRIYYPVAIVWLGLSELLGSVMSRVLMSVVFFGVVTPVGIVRRFLGKDSLQLRTFGASGESVMLVRNHKFVGRDLERPY